MSRDTRLMWGVTLVTVPTIVFGGLAVLGVISGGLYGLPGPAGLTPLQVAFYRAGHAHAGVLLILSLLMQLGLDYVRLRGPGSGRCAWPRPPRLCWSRGGSSEPRTRRGWWCCSTWAGRCWRW